VIESLSPSSHWTFSSEAASPLLALEIAASSLVPITGIEIMSMLLPLPPREKSFFSNEIYASLLPEGESFFSLSLHRAPLFLFCRRLAVEGDFFFPRSVGPSPDRRLCVSFRAADEDSLYVGFHLCLTQGPSEHLPCLFALSQRGGV